MQLQIYQSSASGKWLVTLFPVLTFLFGIYYFCFRILGLHLEFLPGDLGDSRFINFLLEHGYRVLTFKEANFWNAEYMYPFKNTIALSDNLIGAIPFYSVWRLVGFEMETAYQLWWLTMCSLNFWICYYILKKWKFNPLVAAILAWLFAFSIFNIGQLNFMQMIMRFMVPVAFYAAAKLVSTPAVKYLAWFCFAVIFQLYCVMYTGIYLFYFGLLFIFIYCLLNKNFKNLLFYFQKPQLKYVAIIACISLTLVVYILFPYYQMSKAIGLRMFQDVVPNLPLLSSFLLPPESSISWHFLTGPMRPNMAEYWLHYGFPGGVLFLTILISPITIVYFYVKKKSIDPLLGTFIICAFMLAILHLRTSNGLTLYALIFKLPGINSIRIPIRFMHVELFLLVFIFGYWIRNQKPLILLSVFVLVIADNLFDPSLLPRTEKAELIQRKNILASKIRTMELPAGKTIAVLDTTKPSFVTHLDAMLVAQSLGLKTINGYSSYCHDDFGVFFNKCNEDGLKKWINKSGLNDKDIVLINLNNP